MQPIDLDVIFAACQDPATLLRQFDWNLLFFDNGETLRRLLAWIATSTPEQRSRLENLLLLNPEAEIGLFDDRASAQLRRLQKLHQGDALIRERTSSLQVLECRRQSTRQAIIDQIYCCDLRDILEQVSRDPRTQAQACRLSVSSVDQFTFCTGLICRLRSERRFREITVLLDMQQPHGTLAWL